MKEEKAFCNLCNDEDEEDVNCENCLIGKMIFQSQTKMRIAS